MRKTFMIIGILFFSIYTLAGAFLFLNQEELLYHPPTGTTHNLETLVFENDGLKINVLLSNSPSKDAIIYLGGNAEDVLRNVSYYQVAFPDKRIYFMRYRGYGYSEGHPSQKGLFSDAIKLFDLVKDKHETITVIGRSLGTGVATYLASERDVDKLVLVTPYDSIARVAKAKFPMYPVDIMLRDKYPSYKYAPTVKAKILVLIAAQDEVIPRESSVSLMKEFDQEDLSFGIIDGATHNSIASHDHYKKMIEEFVSD